MGKAFLTIFINTLPRAAQDPASAACFPRDFEGVCMNRSSRSAIKHKHGHTAMPDHAARGDEPDYEAIETAVMQTARGRWFLAEYLRRHQNDETRRLATALRKLASAQERLLMPARENAALDGIRLLLARAADELAPSGEERTLPEAAASRLCELLSAAATNAHEAITACDVMADCCAQLAVLLGEPRPRAHARPPEAAEAEAFVAACATTTAAAETLTPSPETPRPAPATDAHADGSDDSGRKNTEDLSTRIVIRRRPRSGEVNIPLPDNGPDGAVANDASRPADENGERSATPAPAGRVRLRIRTKR
jgi:hypothetical protein